MAISFIDSSTSAAVGTTSLSVAYPTSGGAILADDLLVLHVVNKYPTNGPSSPGGSWVTPSNNQASGGIDPAGIDDGQVYSTIYYLIAAGGESGNVSVTITSGNAAIGAIHRYRKGSGEVWGITCTTASDNTAGTSVSFTGAANLSVSTGDELMALAGYNTDAYTYSSVTLSATSATLGTASEFVAGTSQGQDCHIHMVRRPCSSGTSSAAPTLTATASGSTATAVGGAAVFIRVRVTTPPTLIAASGSYVITGNDATLRKAVRMTAGERLGIGSMAIGSTFRVGGYIRIGSYVLTGNDVMLTYTPAGSGTHSTLTADSGSYVVTGNDVALKVGRKLVADAGTYAITGNDVSLPTAKKLTAESGSYALTGNDAALKVGHQLVASSGSYAITGNDVVLRVAKRLVAEVGSYSITGNAVALATAKKLIAESAAYNLTGNAVALTVSHPLVAQGGSYSLTGLNVSMTVARRLVAESGTYTITGNNVALEATGSAVLIAESGSYVCTGRDVELRVARRMTAEIGSYNLSGQDVATPVSRMLIAESGELVLTGLDVGLTSSVVSSSPAPYIPTMEKPEGSSSSQKTKSLLEQQIEREYEEVFSVIKSFLSI
jgi:hypothetical protein